MVAALILNPFVVSTANSAEAVGGGKAVQATKTASGAAKAQELTDEEKKMGGTRSPYPSCSGMLMVEYSDFQKNKAYWEARKTNCDSKVASCNLSVQMIPDSGTFASRTVTAGRNVSSDVGVGVFLEKVRVRASEDLTRSIKSYEQLQSSCLSGSTKAETCGASISSIQQQVSNELPTFRKNIAMMSYPSDSDIQRAVTTRDFSELVNEDLSGSRAGTIVPKMAKLTSAELDAAKKEYADLFSRARKEFDEENEKLLEPLKVKGREADLAYQRSKLREGQNFTAKVKEVIAKMRTEKLKEYNAAVGRVPEIAYVGEAKASDAVIAAGIATLVKDAKGSLSRIDKKPEAKELTAEKTDSSLLQYAAYSRLIDKMLTEEQTAGGKSSCAVATAAFNQLKTVEGRNTGYAVAGIVGVSVLAIAAPYVLPASMTAGAAAAAAPIAVASGMIGGLGMTGMDAWKASNMSQDARSGLTTAEDAAEARNSAGVGLLLSPLDFMGGGAVVGGAVALGGKVLAKRNAKTLLGRTPEAVDHAAFKELAQAGLLGTEKQPLHEVAKDYAEITKNMSEAERKAYAERLKAVADAAEPVKGAKTASGEAVGDPARAREAGLTALAIAQDAPNPAAAAAILKPDSGWNSESLRGVREVLTSAKALAKGSSEAVGSRVKKAYASLYEKATGKKPTQKMLDEGCACLGYCPVAASITPEKSIFDGMDRMLAGVALEPVYTACVAH